MQEFINLKQEFTYLKTHNAMCTINNYPFTNKEKLIEICGHYVFTKKGLIEIK